MSITKPLKKKCKVNDKGKISKLFYLDAELAHQFMQQCHKDKESASSRLEHLIIKFLCERDQKK